jgi:putative SOS response-associated peptidase YedK
VTLEADKRASKIMGHVWTCSLSTDYSETRIKLKFDPDYPAPNIPASWNVCPSDPMLVAIRSKDGKRIPQQMRWGLVPWWAERHQGRLLFNQRAGGDGWYRSGIS